METGRLKHLLCFGFGYCARTLVNSLDRTEWRISATYRDDAGRHALEGLNLAAVAFDGYSPVAHDALSNFSHVLISIPPGKNGDPVLAACGNALAGLTEQIEWAGYLSTTGVYGDRQGGWVDETSALTPSTERGERRVAAENGWLALYRQHGLAVHIFRLAGIYGPGRNQLETLKNGKVRRIVKQGQLFSRIHVDDIAGVLTASMAKPDPGTAYNVCDNEATPPQDVIAHAAKLLNMTAPPEVAFEDADLSPMARSFYAESKQVSNKRIKQELSYVLAYPTYREGLRALLE